MRRLRGLLGLSIATAIAWIPLGALIAMVDSVVIGGRAVVFGRVFASAPVFAAVGAFCGFTFGLALAAAERKRNFDSLRLGRFVALGVASAMVIPTAAILFSAGSLTLFGLGYSLALFGVPGGLSAAAILSIARRAPPGKALAAPPHAAMVAHAREAESATKHPR